jgi:phage gp36-like protein
MPYATQADLEARFGQRELIQLTDRAIPPTGAVDGAVLNAALADADARIDAYLQGRYTLPLADAPAILVQLASDIARYLLQDDRATDEVRRRYGDAIRYLEQVAAGKVSLSPAPGGETAVSSDAPQYSSAPRVFSAETLGDY